MVKAIKRLINRLDQNPLVSVEQRIWRRQLGTPTGRQRWLNLLLGWTTVVLSIVLYVSELIRALLGSDLNTVPRNAQWLMGAYALLALIFYTTPWRQGQRLAQEMIARDKSRPQSWELVVLTGIDARSYVLAKWWALVRALSPALLYTGIVRAGAVTFLVAEFTRSLAANSRMFSGNVIVYPPNALDILIVGILSIVLTYTGLPGVCAVYIDNALDSRRNGNSWWGSFMRNTLTFVVGVIVIFGALGMIAAFTAIFAIPSCRQ